MNTIRTRPAQIRVGEHVHPRRRLKVAVLATAAALVALLGAGPASAKSRPAVLTILHGLPRFTADVYVNDALTLDGFEPESLTEPLELDAGTYDVAIRNVGDPPDSEPAVAATIGLKSGKNYSAIAHLDDDGEATLALFENDLAAVPLGRSRLVVRNVADAGRVQFVIDEDVAAERLAVGHQRASTRAPGKYSVDVATVDGSQLLSDMPLTLREGSQGVVYLVGSEAEGTLDLMFQEFAELQSSPTGVITGSGGLGADPGFPAWAVWLMVASGLSACVAFVFLHRSRRSLAVAGLSLAVLATTPLGWAMARPDANVGAIPGSVRAVPAQPRAVLAPRPAGALEADAGASSPRAPSIAVSSARLIDHAKVKDGPSPVHLSIPSIGLGGRVVAVGVEATTGNVEIPSDVRTAGWYRFGPRPGDHGSAVLVGHVSSAGQGPGLFFRLRELQPGARILVGFESGPSSWFRVTARRSYLKADLPQDIFSRSGTPRLVLVTCGGPFDQTTGHYEDNVVVYAVPTNEV